MGNGRLGLGFSEKLGWQKTETTVLKSHEAEHVSENSCCRPSNARQARFWVIGQQREATNLRMEK
jgi:hypothetical protein